MYEMIVSGLGSRKKRVPWLRAYSLCPRIHGVAQGNARVKTKATWAWSCQTAKGTPVRIVISRRSSFVLCDGHKTAVIESPPVLPVYHIHASLYATEDRPTGQLALSFQRCPRKAHQSLVAISETKGHPLDYEPLQRLIVEMTPHRSPATEPSRSKEQ